MVAPGIRQSNNSTPSNTVAHKPRTGSNRGRGILANGRSRRQGESFLRLAHRLIDAPAFKALSPPARSVLLLVMGRWRGDPADNGALPFAARDAAPWGIGRTQASEALAELVALGFLDCTREAALLGRLARRWSCSELPTMDGRGREVAPTFAARRLSQAEVDHIVAALATARKEARKVRDPGSLKRLAERKTRPHTRTLLSAHADANPPEVPDPPVVSAHADANSPPEAPLCPHTRTVSRSTMLSREAAPAARPISLADGAASFAHDDASAASACSPSLPAAEPARTISQGVSDDGRENRRGWRDPVEAGQPDFEERKAETIRVAEALIVQPGKIVVAVSGPVAADHQSRARQHTTRAYMDRLHGTAWMSRANGRDPGPVAFQVDASTPSAFT